MEEKYLNYVREFKKLANEDKQEEIIDNLKDLINLNYKICNDFDKTTQPLPVFSNNNEFLDIIFTYIISLKEMSSTTAQIIYENLYE